MMTTPNSRDVLAELAALDPWAAHDDGGNPICYFCHAPRRNDTAAAPTHAAGCLQELAASIVEHKRQVADK